MNVSIEDKTINKFYASNPEKIIPGFGNTSDGESSQENHSSTLRSDKLRGDGDRVEVTPLKYLQSLSEKEMKAYQIAKTCLGTSFELKKSNGYLFWLKERSTVSAEAFPTPGMNFSECNAEK